jgi:hypothetical protein
MVDEDVRFKALVHVVMTLDSLVELATEHQDVRFGTVMHVVEPARGLLHSKVPPLTLVQQVVPGHQPGDLTGQTDMPVFVNIILIVLRVGNLDHCGRHAEATAWCL